MQFAGKVPSIWDEVSWGSDSFLRNGLYKIESYTYVRGDTFGGDFRDYYRLDLLEGTYTLYLTTDGLNASPVLNSAFQLDIVDDAGNVILSEQTSSIDAYTDQISFTYSGTGDYYARITAFGSFNYRAAVSSVISPPPILEPPLPDDWRLFTTTGFLGGVGGYGRIFGTSGSESIIISGSPGSIVLDPSFNRGNDLITLDGNASAWRITRSSSQALLTDGDTFIQIPIGLGTALKFDDGVRTLAFDVTAGVAKIGSQSFNATAFITAGPEASGPAQNLNVEAIGRMFMAPGGEAIVAGNFRIIGTSANEHVTLLAGKIELDGSFNRGGDTIDLFGTPQSFTAQRSGSSVLLVSSTLTAIIPFGTEHVDLVFAGSVRDLYFDLASSNVFIGEQPIGSTPGLLIA